MSVRAAVRYATALLGAFLAVNRLLSARSEWVLWHRPDMKNDPSALELYQSGFWVNIASAVAACAVAECGSDTWGAGRIHKSGCDARIRPAEPSV
jgi:hypothetical protein